MADNSGFIDLRVGHGARGVADESVWPSFTDIMTVIVMIFLMALVVMMVRNLELDRQLVTTLDQRQAGLLENRSLTDKLAAVEGRVTELQQELGVSVSAGEALQVQLLEELRRIELLAANNVDLETQLGDLVAARNRLAEEKRELAELQRQVSARLAAAEAEGESLLAQVGALFTRATEEEEARGEAEQQVAALTESEARLSGDLAALSARLESVQVRSGERIESLSTANLSLSEQLEVVGEQLISVRALLQAEQQQRRLLDAQVAVQNEELLNKQGLLAQLQLVQQQSAQSDEDAQAEIEQLNQLIRQRQVENAALAEAAETTQERFRSLQDEYDSLDARYRDLARPARNPAGKYVVEVWIARADDGYRFQLKEGDDAVLVDYSRAELHRQLAGIKAEQGGNLYARVVIPENSGLSHDEAWRLTQEILQGYDYYYQEYPGVLGGDGELQ